MILTVRSHYQKSIEKHKEPYALYVALYLDHFGWHYFRLRQSDLQITKSFGQSTRIWSMAFSGCSMGPLSYTVPDCLLALGHNAAWKVCYAGADTVAVDFSEAAAGPSSMLTSFPG